MPVASAPAPIGAVASSGIPGASTGRPSGQSAPGNPAGQSASTATGTARPAPNEFVAVSDLQDIHFDFDKYAVRPEDGQILKGNARWLKANGGDLLLIEGHCDERGTEGYNLALGDRRAKAAMNYLIAQGVAERRISVISYGKERPVCTEHDKACWAKNRRAHFLVKHG
jgi:peptidoglycan-associated lipoprotein